MILSDYTFTLNTGVSATPVTPVISNILFADELDEETGVYRKTLETDFIFEGDDYTTITNLGVSTPSSYAFQVLYNASAVYDGYLRLGSGDITVDEDNCRITAKIDPNDDYSCLYDTWEDTINILNGTTKVSATTLLGTLSEVTCGPVNNPVPIQINGFFEQNVSSCISAAPGAYSLKRAYIEEVSAGASYDHFATWVTEQVTTNCSAGSPQSPPGDGWVLITDDCGGSGTATYGRAPQMNYVGELSSTTGKFWDNTYEVAGGGEAVGISNGVHLEELLETFVPSECSLTVKSKFFQINDTASAGLNSAYQEAADNLADVIVFQKSDVKRADAFMDATQGEWTFKEIMEVLNRQFNVEFRIENSDFRIEHVSYWSKASGIDLTSAAPNSTLLVGTKEYTFDNANLARQERWEFMETTSFLFTGYPVIYSDISRGEDVKEEEVYLIDRVNNDVGYIISNTDQVDDDGFVFVNAYLTGGSYYLITEASEFGGDLLLNGHMSIPNLLDHYHKWDRLFPTGRMNNVLTTFETSVRRRKQELIRVQLKRQNYHDNFNPDNLVKTGLGWGEVISARFSAADCTLELAVRYD